MGFAAIIPLIMNAFKLIFFFLDLWKEKDQEKAEQKAEIAKAVVNAFKQTNPEKRASRLNTAIDAINRL